MVHAAHVVVHAAGHGAVLGLERGEDIVGRGADTVGPVVEGDDPFVVVAAGFGGVVDDQRLVQAAVDLHPGVGVEEVGSRVGGDELVGEAAAGLDGLLGDAGHTVAGIAQGDAVPVDGGAGGQLVVDAHLQQVTGAGPQDRGVEVSS